MALALVRSIFSRPVVINGTYLAISNALQYALAFFTGVLIARILGADALGVFGLASAIGQIASRVADCGMSTIVTRMISRDEATAGERIATALAFRLWISIASVAAIEAFALAIGYSLDVQVALTLYAVGQVVGGVRDTASCAYFGRQAIARPAIASALFRVVSFALTVGFLAAGLGIIWTMVAMLVGQVAASLFLAAGPEKAARQLPLRLDRAGTFALLRASYPLAISGVFTMVNMRADAMILSLNVDKTHLGYYSGAYAVIIGLSLFPSSLLPALYPAISKRFHENRRGAAQMFVRSQLVNAALGVVFALVLGVTATTVMTLLYGRGFAVAGSVLAVLGWAVPCTYVSYTNSMFFNACDRQDLNLWTAVLAGVVNVVANVMLDPTYGIVGAAWATVLSEAVFLGATSILVVLLIAEHKRS